MLPMLPCHSDDAVSLMSVLCCQFAVPLQYFLWRQQLLPIPRVVGSDLRCRCATDSLFPQMVLDLFPSWTGRFQVLFGVATDFRLSVLPALQFIAQHLQPHCQFGAIDRSHVSLRDKEFVGLETPRCSIRLLGHIEDDGMGVKLRGGVTINGSGGIVFKGSSNKPARGLRRVNIADTGLRVSL